MQRSTDKQITRSELTSLRKEIIEQHRHCEAARSSVTNAQQLALWHGWQVGIRLNRIKSFVGSGDWEDWMESNLPFSDRTAQLYMKIDNDNAELRAKAQRVAPGQPDFKLLRKLKFDTVRKYAINQFVPEKEQPEHKGNLKFPRHISFVNIANEYNKLRYRHTSGLQPVDFNIAREETRELFDFLKWLHGESKVNPWDHKEDAAAA